MTNTHRKTTNRTTAKIAAVGAFGIGAAIAFPGLAAAQGADTTDPTASLAEATGEDGSLEGALGTDLGIDLGSLSFDLNLDAETPSPGSVEFGSLGVSPNTGSEAIDGGGPTADSGSLGSGEGDTRTAAVTDEAEGTGSLGSGDAADDDDTAEDTTTGGSLDLGSLGSSEEPAEGTATAAETGEAADTGSLGSGDEAADDTADSENGSLSGSLAGLSSGADDDTVDETVGAGVNADVGIAAGSLG